MRISDWSSDVCSSDLLLLELFGLVLADAFLDGLRRAFDEILRLLEAEPGNGTHLFDDVDLLLAGRGQYDVELGLRLGSRFGRSRGIGRGPRGGRRGAPGCARALGTSGAANTGEF